MLESAKEPNDLERLFVERANAKDIKGLVALYEEDAVLDCGNGEHITGPAEIARFFSVYLQDKPRFEPSIQDHALVFGEIALTSSRHSNGDVSAEVARRQSDGSWLWIVDRLTVGKHR